MGLTTVQHYCAGSAACDSEVKDDPDIMKQTRSQYTRVNDTEIIRKFSNASLGTKVTLFKAYSNLWLPLMDCCL